VRQTAAGPKWSLAVDRGESRISFAPNATFLATVPEVEAMKNLLIAIALVVVSFGAGFWLEHGKRMAAQGELERDQVQLAESQERVRASELLGQLLNLKDVAAARDYGHAQELSTRFFDAARLEAGRVGRPTGLHTALEAVLATRDGVTAALARSDPASVELIRTAETRLRQGLGYAVPPGAGAVPAPLPSPTAVPAP
jgi:hypothetical protein